MLILFYLHCIFPKENYSDSDSDSDRIRQRYNLQLCRVPGMMSLQRHYTSHWSSISSSHQRGSGKTCTILQTIPEEVKAAT